MQMSKCANEGTGDEWDLLIFKRNFSKGFQVLKAKFFIRFRLS